MSRTSIVCEDDFCLLELTRYIHLNPLRGRLVMGMEELSGYLWSAHSVIMGRVKREWQDREAVSACFGKRRKRAIEGYEQFVKKGIAEGRRDDLVGGGLVRSLGGWSEVLSLRMRGEKVASDERILGCSEFGQAIMSEVEEKLKENLRPSVRKPDLPSSAREI